MALERRGGSRGGCYGMFRRSEAEVEVEVEVEVARRQRRETPELRRRDDRRLRVRQPAEVRLFPAWRGACDGARARARSAHEATTTGRLAQPTESAMNTTSVSKKTREGMIGTSASLLLGTLALGLMLASTGCGASADGPQEADGTQEGVGTTSAADSVQPTLKVSADGQSLALQGSGFKPGWHSLDLRGSRLASRTGEAPTLIAVTQAGKGSSRGGSACDLRRHLHPGRSEAPLRHDALLLRDGPHRERHLEGSLVLQLVPDSPLWP